MGFLCTQCNNWMLFFLLISLEICKACCCASCCNGDCLEVACHTTPVLESFSRASHADVSLAIKCCVPGRTLACKHHSAKDSIWALKSSRSSWVFWGFSLLSLLLGIWPFVHVNENKACLLWEFKSVTLITQPLWCGSGVCAWLS